MQHKILAPILSLIPGIGQFYNKQRVKGLLFLSVSMIVFSFLRQPISQGLWGFVTLGTEVPRDHSIFLLAQGIIAIIFLVLIVFFYYLNLKDAYINGKKIDEGESVNSLSEDYKMMKKEGYPYLISSPALFLLIFAVVFPIIFSFSLAFTNYNLYNSPPAKLVDWVGLETFKSIFTVNIWRKTFFDVLGWTVIWTLLASTLQVTVGIVLAVVANQKELKFKKFFRTILVLPWAVPGFVTILIFAGMFNDSFGAINKILTSIGLSSVPWLTNAKFTKIALIAIQGWLGFPYIFVVTTGVLQSIPDDLYEAARIDGASALQQFFSITLPLILRSISPILISQYTFNFNNFNIIYLFNGGGPSVGSSGAGGTDILVSWIYKLTMRSSQYSLAAALTILLSVFVIGIALWQFKKTSMMKEDELY